MADRTIKHLSFRYTDENGNEKTALQNDTVDLSKDDIERGDRIGAFKSDADETAGFDAATASDEELAAWFDSEKPKVGDVVGLASDPATAQRLLDAETAAQDGSPRKGVVDGLAAVIGSAQ